MDNENEQNRLQKKEKPLHELLTSSLVDMYIGPDSTHWTIHERLLTYHSPALASTFYGDDDKEPSGIQKRGNKSYGLPEEDDHTFELFVSWLYSRTIQPPKVEKDIGPLLDLYLLSEKFQIEKLSLDIVELVREHYHSTSTYPGLRRVQYIYAETDEDNAMREMMVSSIARQLTTGDKIPLHWATALKRNGQLAVDIIRSIQQWHIEERSIPDVRDGSQARGRTSNGGAFSAVVREADSLDTTTAETVDTNLGVESVQSEEGRNAKEEDNESQSEDADEDEDEGEDEQAKSAGEERQTSSRNGAPIMPRSTSSRVELPDSLQQLRPYMELPEEEDDYDEEEEEEVEEEEEDSKPAGVKSSQAVPPTSTDMKLSFSLSPPPPPPPEPTSHILDHPLTDHELDVDTNAKISRPNGTAQPSASLASSGTSNKKSMSSSISKSSSQSHKSTTSTSNSESSSPTMTRLLSRAPRAEFMFLAAAWLVYLVYAIAALGLFEKKISLGIDMRQVQKWLPGGGESSSSSSLLPGAGWVGNLFNHDRQPVLGFGRAHGHGLSKATATATGTGMGNWFGKWAGSTSPRLGGLGHRGAGRWS